MLRGTTLVRSILTDAASKLRQKLFLLTAGRFNGRTRRGLVLLLVVRAAPRPFSASCFLPFSILRAFW